MRLCTFAAALPVFIGLSGCAGVARPSITVYTKRDFAGEAATLRSAYADLEEDLPGFDREISSFEIARGTWQICRKKRFKSCRTTDRSMADLGDWDGDNAIRSLRPVAEEDYAEED
jgi:hypothetical protein